MIIGSVAAPEESMLPRCAMPTARSAWRARTSAATCLRQADRSMMRQNLCWAGGFALLSSRCSYELVEKAVLSGCPMLVTISAPTSLALSQAREAGLDLRVLARPDSVLSPMAA